MSWGVCNGICKNFKEYKTTCRNAYIDGFTRCNCCNIFFKCSPKQLKCECCKSRLRHPKKIAVRL